MYFNLIYYLNFLLILTKSCLDTFGWMETKKVKYKQYIIILIIL